MKIAVKLAAWGAAALSIAMWAVTVVLIVLSPSETYLGSAFSDGGFITSFVAFSVVGALIAARHVRLSIGWLLCAVGLGMTADLFLARALLYLRVTGGELPPAALWLYNWLWVPPTVALTTFLPLLFPDGALPGRRWRPAVVASWGAAASLTGNFMFGARITEPFADLVNPFHFAGLADLLELVELAGFLVWGVATFASVAALVVRFRRSRGIERQQLKWFAYAAALAAALIMLYGGLAVAFGERAAIQIVGAVFPFPIVLVPLAIAAAILRYRLYDIDVFVRRTLVYGVLSATLVATYAASVVLLQAAVRPLTGGSDLAVAVSTLATLALVQPLRRRIQDAVDRRFYRSRYDAARTLDAFSVRLRDEVDLDALRTDLLGAVRDTVEPAHASVWLRERAR